MFWFVSYHLGAFGIVKLPNGTRGQTFRTSAKVRGVFRDERTRSTPLDPKLTFWCVSYHLEPLGFLTKLGAKQSELVQKFVPRSRVGILCNECTRSTPSDPKLLFCCVLYYLGAFGTVKLPYKTRGKTFRTSAKVRDTKSRRSLSRRTHPIHPHWTLNSCFGAFRTIWVHLGPFGCLMKLDAKRAELLQKFVPRSQIGIFHDERTRSTPNDTKLMFWCVSYHLGAFGSLTKLGAKRAERAKVRATKSL